jgi:trk system potassium uptake protein TrkA
VKIVVLGAGHVGATVVAALHDEHDLTVVDLDATLLTALSYRYDVRVVEGNAAARSVLQDAGVREANLVIACTSRDEVNLVSAMLAKRLSDARTIVRVTDPEYLEAWREKQIDVDFMVSSELETANVISSIVGVPAARQTDVFAEGQVQIVEFDVEPDTPPGEVVGKKLREARIPHDSKVASIIRGDAMIVPRGDASILPGDRVIIIGSPDAAKAWSRTFARYEQRMDDIVIFGAGKTGVAIARVLRERDIRIRLLEADPRRARAVAELLPDIRVFNASGMDPEFLERERIGSARAAIFAMADDARNLYGALLAKQHGVGFTVAIIDEPVSVEVFERGGIDVAVNPRSVTAEEMVRFAHDPRTLQVAMLEGDRFEVLDITVRPESQLVRVPFKELPMTGSLIGAIVRNGTAIFPHGDDVLLPGDRVIIFTESARTSEVERAL